MLSLAMLCVRVVCVYIYVRSTKLFLGLGLGLGLRFGSLVYICEIGGSHAHAFPSNVFLNIYMYSTCLFFLKLGLGLGLIYICGKNLCFHNIYMDMDDISTY